MLESTPRFGTESTEWRYFQTPLGVGWYKLVDGYLHQSPSNVDGSRAVEFEGDEDGGYVDYSQIDREDQEDCTRIGRILAGLDPE